MSFSNGLLFVFIILIGLSTIIYPGNKLILMSLFLLLGLSCISVGLTRIRRKNGFFFPILLMMIGVFAICVAVYNFIQDPTILKF